uniref:NIDO domain-containing protein n=1 Tax=Leptobrachium leishanense TaxID=445787 RepID=A0A8C5Q7X8_9ANUR
MRLSGGHRPQRIKDMLRTICHITATRDKYLISHFRPETDATMRLWTRQLLLLLALPSMLCYDQVNEGEKAPHSFEMFNDDVLFAYGPAYNDHKTLAEDDGVSDEIHFRLPVKFFGTNFRKAFVNNNGGISFNEPIVSYTPEPFPIRKKYIMMPFWADVDPEICGDIFFGERIDEFTLNKLEQEFAYHLPDQFFKPVWCFVVTWHKVAYYGSESDKTNTFQAILTTDHHHTFVMYNYGNVEWTTGAASGGDPMTGLGGIQAQAGFNADDEYFSIPGSRSEHIVNIKDTTNCNRNGRWLFQVDNFKVPGGCVFEATYLTFGQFIWKDEVCSTKCSCRHSGKIECFASPCSGSDICVPMGKHYMCQMDEKEC